MNPSNVFQIDLAAKLTPRRSFMLRMGLPMLLALPFALAAMPPGAKASGMAMLVLFLAFFGAAVAMVRRRSDGTTERLRTLPLPIWQVSADLMLADVTLDLVQVAGPMTLLLAVNACNLRAGGVVVIAGLLTLVAAVLNLLGMLLASAMKGNPDVHLAGALSVGVIAAGSGLFPLPPRLAGAIGAISAYNPISLFAEALRRSVEGTFQASPGQVIAASAVLAVLGAAILLRAVGLPTNAKRA